MRNLVKPLIAAAVMAICSTGAAYADKSVKTTSFNHLTVRGTLETHTRYTQMRDDGGLPREWLDQWCITGTSRDESVFKRAADGCPDWNIFDLEERSFSYLDSVCDLMDGKWDTGKKSYIGVYECGDEGVRVYRRIEFTYDALTGLHVNYTGSIESPVPG